MIRIVVSRLVSSAAAVFGASIVAFIFLRLLPSNPARLILGQFASPRAIAEQTKAMGLDQPVWIQYWRYIIAFFHGDWGFAYSVGQPVTTELGQRLPASLELGFYAFLGALVAAVAAALLATYRHRPFLDGCVRAAASLGLGIPPFWFGLIVLLVFSQTVPLFPGPEGRLSPSATPPPNITHFYTIDALITGHFGTAWDAFRHLFLPALTLSLPAFGFLVRLLRASLIDISHSEFLMVARSKGLSRWRVYRRHALPNAMLPTLTAGGLVLAQFLAGSVLVESVFNWPGIGALIVDSVLRHDYAVVETFVLLSAIAYVVVNIAVDVLYMIIDPRVREGSR
jgi:ABC-type dipeptide/oligopeptide/nickel transport system permease component